MRLARRAGGIPVSGGSEVEQFTLFGSVLSLLSCRRMTQTTWRLTTMNGRKSKLLRKAAGGVQRPTTYEKLQLGRVLQLPTYEQHTRVVRSVGCDGKVFRADVTKTRFLADGKTPAHMIMDAKGQPVVQLVPTSLPIRLKVGTGRQIYQYLKRTERRIGLDRLFATRMLAA